MDKNEAIKEYKEIFKNRTREEKIKDLKVHPFIIKDGLEQLSDDEIDKTYAIIFGSLDMSMMEVLGESIFDDDEFDYI